MPVYGIKLFFTSPLHMGELGLGMEDAEIIIHSDTLYSAIHNTWLRVYDAGGPLPLKISSAYPFVDDKFYLPKPGLEPPGFDDLETRESYAKTVKGTAFLSFDVFKRWIERQKVDYETVVKENNFLECKIEKIVRPRVKLDRVDMSSALYHIGEVIFEKGHAGLYFAVQCSEETYKKLKVIMRILADEGIGGERSSGYGRFKVEFIEDFELPEVEGGRRFVGISLYYPASKEEFKGAMESYMVVRRGGWTAAGGNNYPIKRIVMFSEGSVFKKMVEGAVADVAPTAAGHPVYRFGKAFLLRAR